jgi:hypothetical protein
MLEHLPQGLQIGFPKFNGILFSALGPIIQGHKVKQFLVTWGQIEEIFSISALSPSIKPLGPISTFAPIEMLDLS